MLGYFKGPGYLLFFPQFVYRGQFLNAGREFGPSTGRFNLAFQIGKVIMFLLWHFPILQKNEGLLTRS